MNKYSSVGIFLRVFSSKNTCLRLPDIIFFAYYTCFLVEILGFVLALRSPLQANLKIPCKTRLHAKKGEGPRQVKSENSRVLAIFLALARPIWKYIVMYPFSPLQANLKIPRKTLALFTAKKKPFPMQIQKLSYLHLGLNLISGPQNTKSERHSNDVDFFWKPLIKIRFFDRLWPLALWGPILENNLVQDEVFPNWRWRGLNYMKMPRAGRAFSKFASAKA